MSAIAMPAPTAPNTPPPIGGPRPWLCTVEQYEKMCKAGFFGAKRYQLIRGEIIDMGPEGARHFTTVDLAVEILRAVFGSGFYVRQAGPIRFSDSIPEPDVAVVTGKRADYATKHPDTALLAVEVSDTTLSYDLTTKAELYATAGIPEYWVLDLDGRQLHVFRDPNALPPALEATAYRTHTSHTSGDTVHPLHAPGAVAVADLLS